MNKIQTVLLKEKIKLKKKNHLVIVVIAKKY